jgi:hypothetical protein
VLSDHESKGPGAIIDEDDSEPNKIGKHATCIYGIQCFKKNLLLDSVSYDANVSKLLDLARNFASIHPLKVLWRATFAGRRNELLTGKITGVDHMLKTRCPLLDKEEFVS